MWKKLIGMLAVISLLGSFMSAPTWALESTEHVSEVVSTDNTAALAPSARSAILMDADSGTIIFEKNSHEKLPPASITKIMTMLLVMEAIDAGTLKMTDKVRTSANAASMGGSQIFLEEGEEMTVEDMLKGVAMASGNDASVALAEKLAGTEAQFVTMMNERAEKLGLKNTHFMNTNGLPVENHYSSAHDIAQLSRELLKHTEVTQFTSKYQDYLRKDTEKPFWLVNTNKLVRFYPGADGLKTGYTSEAKFCVSATATRDGMRVIAVVLGEPSTKQRNAEVTSMFDYAFSQYMNFPLVKKGEQIGEMHIEKGMEAKLQLIAEQPYGILIKRGTPTDQIHYELDLDESIKAPIMQGQPIGKFIIYQGDQVLKEYEITSPKQIDRANWWRLLKRSTSSLFN